MPCCFNLLEHNVWLCSPAQILPSNLSGAAAGAAGGGMKQRPRQSSCFPNMRKGYQHSWDIWRMNLAASWSSGLLNPRLISPPRLRGAEEKGEWLLQGLICGARPEFSSGGRVREDWGVTAVGHFFWPYRFCPLLTVLCVVFQWCEIRHHWVKKDFFYIITDRMSSLSSAIVSV